MEPWFGETALMWAASENHGAVVRLLVESGAAVNARSKVLDAPVLEFPRSGGPNSPLPRGGWTALMFAAREGSIDAARALAESGADLNATALPQTDVPLKPEEIEAAAKGVGTTALVYAIINSHFDLAAMLVEKGADPNVADMAGEAALYAAVDMNSLQWTQGRPAPIFISIKWGSFSGSRKLTGISQCSTCSYSCSRARWKMAAPIADTVLISTPLTEPHVRSWTKNARAASSKRATEFTND